ncbi:signal peptide peptidase-domain-containing protein [Ochromonadaceae sp. CCMP2298]|nr:signal peptide peptidase-domain-containing protein [Ochromonadaceae sp. CCMP2298]
MKCLHLVFTLCLLLRAASYRVPARSLRHAISKQTRSQLNSLDPGTISPGGVGSPSPSPVRPSLITYAAAFLALPLASLALPALLDRVVDFSIPPESRQYYILALLLSKRLYLYSLAFATLYISATRAYTEPVRLGQRLMQINDGAFEGFPLLDGLRVGPLLADFKDIDNEVTDDVDSAAATDSTLSAKEKEEKRVRKEKAAAVQEFYGSADNVSDEAQAAFLPIALSAALIGSFALLNTGTGVTAPPDSTSAFLTLLEQLKAAFRAAPYLSYLSLLPTGLVCWLFTKSEVSAWPVQNIVNMCIAITTARAVQLPRLPTVLAALAGLVAYDVVAVLGTQQLTDGGQSIMEAVARAKVGIASAPAVSIGAVGASAGAVGAKVGAAAAAAGGGAAGGGVVSLGAAGAGAAPTAAGMGMVGAGIRTWAPGLLVVALGGRVSDGLGLADVVFPCMLASWALRYDESQSNEEGERKGKSGESSGKNIESSASSGDKGDSNESVRTVRDRRRLFPASLVGFMVGCLALEVLQTGGGDPALLFLVPSMAVAVLGTGLANGELRSMWTYEPT